MIEVYFKDGSTVKTQEGNDIARGHRSNVNPYNYDETYIDMKWVEEVIDEFVNKERLSKQDADCNIYLSNAWNKEEIGC